MVTCPICFPQNAMLHIKLHILYPTLGVTGSLSPVITTSWRATQGWILMLEQMFYSRNGWGSYPVVALDLLTNRVPLCRRQLCGCQEEMWWAGGLPRSLRRIQLWLVQLHSTCFTEHQGYSIKTPYFEWCFQKWNMFWSTQWTLFYTPHLRVSFSVLDNFRLFAPSLMWPVA